MDDIIFKDRRDAGQQLAAALIKRGYRKEPLVVLGIPRGGVVVAAEVATELSAPLDIIIARKLRAPAQPELGIGAVVSSGHLSTINEGLVRTLGVTEDYLEREIDTQWAEIERQLALYRGNHCCPVNSRINLVACALVLQFSGYFCNRNFQIADLAVLFRRW